MSEEDLGEDEVRAEFEAAARVLGALGPVLPRAWRINPAGRIAAALVMIVALLQVMDLLDITTEILDRGLGFAGVAKYALLRLPRLVEQAAPLAALAGGR